MFGETNFRAGLRWLFLGAASGLLLAACSFTPQATETPTATLVEASATWTLEPASETALLPALTATLPPPSAATDTLTPVPTEAATILAPEATATPEPSLTPMPPAPTSLPATPTLPLPTACAYTWFVPNPPKECPGQAPILSLTVAEHFEHGVLLWREKPDFYGSKIYAFFTDNKWPYWNPTNDQWQTGQPESDPTIIPPAGFYQPVRGFGIFWRQAYFGAAGSARDRLGWATDQEFSLGELAMQCRVNATRDYGCLVAGPDNLVYDVEPNNSWSIWQGAK